MSLTTVKTIVARTIEEINNRLTPIHENTGSITTIDLIQNAIVAPINNAYAQVKDSDEDSKMLYRQLSLKFHTDKLNSNTEDSFAKKLKDIAARQTNKDLQEQIMRLGQQAVNAKQAIPLAGDFLNNPSETFNTYYDIITARFHNLFKEYKRYPYPIQYLVYTAQALLNTAIIITGASFFISLVIDFLATKIYMNIEKGWLGFILGNSYHQAISSELTFTKKAAYWRKELTTSNKNLCEESDEDIIKLAKATIRVSNPLYSDDKVEKSLVEPLIEKITGFSHARLILKASQHAMTAPGSSGFLLNNWYRTRLIMALVPTAGMLLVDIALSLIQTAFLYLSLASLVALIAIKISAILVTNSPLYVYDAFAALFTYLRKPPAPGTGNKENNQEHNNNTDRSQENGPTARSAPKEQDQTNHKNTEEQSKSATPNAFGFFSSVTMSKEEASNAYVLKCKL